MLGISVTLNINLINVILIIIFKILAGQLKKKIDDLMESSQSTFLPRRSILDSVICAQEIISICTKYNWLAYFLKLDLQKLLIRLSGHLFSRSSKFRALEIDGMDGFNPSQLWPLFSSYQWSVMNHCNALIPEYAFFYGFWHFDRTRVISYKYFLPFDLKFLHETLHWH